MQKRTIIFKAFRVTTWIIAVVTILAACMLDSQSWMPAIVFFTGATYLLIYAAVTHADGRGY